MTISPAVKLVRLVMVEEVVLDMLAPRLKNRLSFWCRFYGRDFAAANDRLMTPPKITRFFRLNYFKKGFF
jgi:hypothetical protein